MAVIVGKFLIYVSCLGIPIHNCFLLDFQNKIPPCAPMYAPFVLPGKIHTLYVYSRPFLMQTFRVPTCQQKCHDVTYTVVVERQVFGAVMHR